MSEDSLDFRDNAAECPMIIYGRIDGMEWEEGVEYINDIGFRILKIEHADRDNHPDYPEMVASLFQRCPSVQHWRIRTSLSPGVLQAINKGNPKILTVHFDGTRYDTPEYHSSLKSLVSNPSIESLTVVYENCSRFHSDVLSDIKCKKFEICTDVTHVVRILEGSLQISMRGIENNSNLSELRLFSGLDMFLESGDVQIITRSFVSCKSLKKLCVRNIGFQTVSVFVEAMVERNLPFEFDHMNITVISYSCFHKLLRANLLTGFITRNLWLLETATLEGDKIFDNLTTLHVEEGLWNGLERVDYESSFSFPNVTDCYIGSSKSPFEILMKSFPKVKKLRIDHLDVKRYLRLHNRSLTQPVSTTVLNLTSLRIANIEGSMEFQDVRNYVAHILSEFDYAIAKNRWAPRELQFGANNKAIAEMNDENGHFEMSLGNEYANRDIQALTRRNGIIRKTCQDSITVMLATRKFRQSWLRMFEPDILRYVGKILLATREEAKSWI